ncbi:hypothetical protein [Sphingomonas sp. TDK1]|uniref:hypothetical protein n=1 Tax=Sphingomonas sp. TDK1 TaxID=453247 RepID=UPI0007D8E2BF|nr:hypothetical protein [Sphingomonas sp. TDK1]OAN62273.1 hypothetical protein A7X12_22555 [Sphingomonas sp. TDK1]
MIAVARATFIANLVRASRGWGLWLLLLAGPVGARFMIARDDGSGVQIAVGKHLPVISSAVLGVSLGIVVSTLLLPIGFLYLRANATRRQPWQIDEVTSASRVAIALGRFAADVVVLLAMLSTLTLAGGFLGWLIVTGPLDLPRIAALLWLIAAPALIGLAAVHRFLDALPLTRRAAGELVFFILWFASLAMPAAVASQPSSFLVNLADFPGFVRPLAGPVPLAGQDVVIGGVEGLAPGRAPLDVMAGVLAPGYIASRLAWTGIALVLAVLGGLLYRPHRHRARHKSGGVFDRLLAPKPRRTASLAESPPAQGIGLPYLGLVLAEFRLIGAGRLFTLLAIAAALAGLAADYRHIGGAAAGLLLVFALSAHAGRSEAKGLLALTRTAPLPAMIRRVAFLVAGLGWGLLLALPASAIRLSAAPLFQGGGVALVAALIATMIATISHSGFAGRLVLILLWYVYIAA